MFVGIDSMILQLALTAMYGTQLLILLFLFLTYVLPFQHMLWHILPGHPRLHITQINAKKTLFRILSMQNEIGSKPLRQQILSDMFNRDVMSLIESYLPNATGNEYDITEIEKINFEKQIRECEAIS